MPSRVAWGVVAMIVAGCSTVRTRPARPGPDEALLVVDCLLPARMVVDPNLGAVALPRPPSKTTAAACAERGGDYELADPRWALSVWTAAAQRGDAEAQYHLGETYERGLDGPPDYTSAARWYRRAAEQSHRPAAANLARLHERGAGVPLDWLEALRWYQVAAAADPGAALEETRDVLRRMGERERALQDELQRLRRGSGGGSGGCADDAEERAREIIDELRALQTQSPQVRSRIAALVRQLAREQHGAGAAHGPVITRGALGKYYALVIGNDDYLEWPKLETPINDATALKHILEDRYGFEKPVELVGDGNAQAILEKLDEMRRTINREAANGSPVNFLLFYAGHGARRYPIRGHWIPIDAPREFSSKWISDTQIAEQVRAIAARQVLVIADSCYASTLATRGVLQPGLSPTLERIMQERPRMVMSSGGDRPVYEETGAEHSVFASALIEVLRESHGVLKGEDLFRNIVPRVRREAAELGVQQEPQYLPILDGDHSSGDFILVAGD